MCLGQYLFHSILIKHFAVSPHFYTDRWSDIETRKVTEHNIEVLTLSYTSFYIMGAQPSRRVEASLDDAGGLQVTAAVLSRLDGDPEPKPLSEAARTKLKQQFDELQNRYSHLDDLLNRAHETGYKMGTEVAHASSPEVSDPFSTLCDA